MKLPRGYCLSVVCFNFSSTASTVTIPPLRQIFAKLAECPRLRLRDRVRSELGLSGSVGLVSTTYSNFLALCTRRNSASVIGLFQESLLFIHICNPM